MFRPSVAGTLGTMSTSDPLLPSSGDAEETTVAAEPGAGGPRPQAPEEPDVLTGAEPERGSLDDALGDERPPFRTPAPRDLQSGQD